MEARDEVVDSPLGRRAHRVQHLVARRVQLGERVRERRRGRIMLLRRRRRARAAGLRREEHGVDARQVLARDDLGEVPALTLLATQISKDLKAIGFKFLGPTTTYAHMQACGMVNDHLVSCPSHKDCLE